MSMNYIHIFSVYTPFMSMNIIHIFSVGVCPERKQVILVY